MSSILAQAFSSPLLRGFYKDRQDTLGIKLEGTSQEKRRLAALIDRVAKNSPLGREILESAGKGGYTLCFEMHTGIGGMCSEEEKAIGLNPMLTDASLTCTLVHECRHAQQYEQGVASGGYAPSMTLKSQMIEKRLMEADATAISIAVAHDLSEAWDKDPIGKMRWKQPRMVSAYMENYHSSTSEAKKEALTASVLGWYENEEMKFDYEKSYVLYPLSLGMPFENTTGQFKERTAKESIEKVCRLGNENYFTRPPSVLEEPFRAGLSDFSAGFVKEHVAACKKAGAEKMDPTMTQLPTYRLSAFMQRKLTKEGLYMPAPLSDDGLAQLAKAQGKPQASAAFIQMAAQNKKIR